MATDLASREDFDLAHDDCGHVIVNVDGEVQHHEIPDDGAPHAPDGSCGCRPQRYDVHGVIVYEHVDQDLEESPEPGCG